MKRVPGLADFAGDWLIRRRIDDRRGPGGRFEGRAAFYPEREALRYREAGLLHLGAGPALRAVRGYLWREAGGRILVEHANGAPFHAFDPGRPQAVHLCPPDRYQGIYDFSGWPEWTAVWTVSGPAKDYTMTSRYRRAAAAC